MSFLYKYYSQIMFKITHNILDCKSRKLFTSHMKALYLKFHGCSLYKHLHTLHKKLGQL